MSNSVLVCSINRKEHDSMDEGGWQKFIQISTVMTFKNENKCEN